MIHSLFAAACQGGSSGNNVLLNSDCLPKTPATPATLHTALLIVFGIIGGIAVLFLIIGGFRYITSGGNSEAVQKAKNQIIYSLVGMVIAAMAFTIVNFVVGKF